MGVKDQRGGVIANDEMEPAARRHGRCVRTKGYVVRRDRLLGHQIQVGEPVGTIGAEDGRRAKGMDGNVVGGGVAIKGFVRCGERAGVVVDGRAVSSGCCKRLRGVDAAVNQGRWGQRTRLRRVDGGERSKSPATVIRTGNEDVGRRSNARDCRTLARIRWLVRRTPKQAQIEDRVSCVEDGIVAENSRVGGVVDGSARWRTEQVTELYVP